MKELIKKKLPSIVTFSRSARALKSRILWLWRRNWTLQQIFQDAYDGMNSLESASGGGSTLSATTRLREELPHILHEFHVRTLLDAPCGDFHWMSQIQPELDIYYGCDIVAELIEKNKQKYENERRVFLNLDITKDRLPKVDMILCRDCLVHFSYKNIFAAINNFKNSGSKYLLTTTFPRRQKNRNIVSGDWRPINLCKDPFCFLEPIRLLEEGFLGDDGRYDDKSLGLWSLENIPSVLTGTKNIFCFEEDTKIANFAKNAF
jgi:hypothetical protein